MEVTAVSYIVSGACAIYASTVVITGKPLLLRRRHGRRLSPVAIRVYGAAWLVFAAYFAAVPTLANASAGRPGTSSLSAMLSGASVLFFTAIVLCAWLIDRRESQKKS